MKSVLNKKIILKLSKSNQQALNSAQQPSPREEFLSIEEKHSEQSNYTSLFQRAKLYSEEHHQTFLTKDHGS